MRTVFIALLCLFWASATHAQCVSGDCKNGRGIYVYPSGAKYIGDFKDGEIHGIGVCYYTDGSKYQGEWQHRYPHGKGTKIYADGHQHTGLWMKGKPVNESGKFLVEHVVPDKEEYEFITDIQSGCIDGDCQNGQGTFAYPDGSKYDGQFKQGRITGLGTWYFANGERYVGSFANNFPHGKGVLYRLDGSVLKGEWKEGEYAGSIETKPKQEGCIKGDCLQGTGTYVFKDAVATYTGQFVNEEPQGKGTIVYANGDKYEGDWSEGAMHGSGVLTMADGVVVKGRWDQGRYMVTEEQVIHLSDSKEPVDPPAIDIQYTAPQKVWAVIVGVGAYTHMPALRYTDDDAYRFYAFLKSVEGGGLRDDQIRILIDEEATRQKILETTRDLFAKAQPEDLILFYFSGHGVKGAFLPFDFDGYYNKIAYEELSDLLAKSKANSKICFADACHSGGLFTDKSASIDQEVGRFYADLYQVNAGTAILMSSKSEETSLESAGLRQGVFSHFMIRGMKGEADADDNGIITIQELYDFIYVNVRAYTGMRQSPLLKGDYDPHMPIAVIGLKG